MAMSVDVVMSDQYKLVNLTWLTGSLGQKISNRLGPWNIENKVDTHYVMVFDIVFLCDLLFVLCSSRKKSLIL